MRKIPINKPSITELEISYVNDAVTNGWGENCYDYLNKFEKKLASFQSTKYALATSSCTGAIHLSLLALGVKPGDEVIVPEITWIASVEPVLYIGAKPVFVDVLEDTWCIDPQSIRNAVTTKTKAIIVVHLYGNLCEMDEIMQIANEYNLVVLEDAAEGLGSVYKGKKAGSIGHVGVFSFHGTKTMSTGEGGAIVTNDFEIYDKVKILNDHGRNPKDPENKMFWMRNYGYKYKMSNLQAAMGCAQLERLDDLVSRKKQIFEIYRQNLAEISCDMNFQQTYASNSYWLPTCVFHKSINFNRQSFFEYCSLNQIDSRPFFFPLSSLPMFEHKTENNVSYDVYERGINLPSFHDITFEEIIKVCNIIKSFLKNK
jgi:perosamine synthetase